MYCDAKKPKDMDAYGSVAEDTSAAFSRVLSDVKQKASKAVQLLKQGNAYQAANAIVSAQQLCMDELSTVTNACRNLKKLYE